MATPLAKWPIGRRKELSEPTFWHSEGTAGLQALVYYVGWIIKGGDLHGGCRF